MTEDIKDLPKLLQKYVGSNKTIVKSEIGRLIPPGENLLSIILKVDVVLKDDETGDVEVIHAVAKRIHSGDNINQMIQEIEKMFHKREVAWYTKIVPTFEKFLEAEGFRGSYDIFPKLYAYRNNLHGENDVVDEDAVILLENLVVKGEVNSIVLQIDSS